MTKIVSIPSHFYEMVHIDCFWGTDSVTELHMLCAWHENSEEKIVC